MESHYTSLLTEQHQTPVTKRPGMNRLKLFWTLVVSLACVSVITTFFVVYHRGSASLPVAELVKINTDVVGAPEFWKEFEQFAKEFGKVYRSLEEKMHRFGIFKNNFQFIRHHNSQGYRYSMAVNHFADLTHEEFTAQYLGFNKIPKHLRKLSATSELSDVDVDALPTEVDWIKKGCVTEVKNQQQCGSCWAFSATGSLEGAVCAKTGTLPNLSEQQLVDCADKQGNQGCSGGEMDAAFQFVIDNNGLCSEADYPYLGVNGNCTVCTPAVKIHGFQDVPKEDENALMAAVAKFGPVAVAIEADQMGFQFYNGGVFDGACGANLDHGVLLVGYGHDEKTKEDYWMVKNSWGAKWGDKGFIRLVRHKGKAGQCGILEDPSYPIV